MSVNYREKPYCTVSLDCRSTTFQKNYYRHIGGHDEETSLRTAAVAAAGTITGYHSRNDYTISVHHSARRPSNASAI